MPQSFGDCDGDGDLDIFIAKRNSVGTYNKILRNDGNWKFTDLTLASAGAGIQVSGQDGRYNGAVWGDYDGDGDLDIFVTNDLTHGGKDRLYKVGRRVTKPTTIIITIDTSFVSTSFVSRHRHRRHRHICTILCSSHLVSSHLISPHLISSHLISPHLISSHLISSRLISSHLISSHLISSHLISSHLTSSLLSPLSSLLPLRAKRTTETAPSKRSATRLGLQLQQGPRAMVLHGVTSMVMVTLTSTVSE